MTRWVRLDADYFTNPKAVAAGRDGRALHLASLCWCAQHLQDGMIPAHMIRDLCQVAGVTRRAVDKLVDTGLWMQVGSYYEIVNYAKNNPTRAQVERERELWKQRQREHRKPGSEGVSR